MLQTERKQEEKWAAVEEDDHNASIQQVMTESKTGSHLAVRY